MAQVKTMTGEQLLVQIGDGATPTEAFAHDCLINTERGISWSASTVDTPVPDCDDPGAPAWITRDKSDVSGTVSGSGLLHTSSIEAWFDWIKSEDAKNCRILTNGVTGANGGGYWSGAFHLTEFAITGNRKELVTVSVTLALTGAATWTDNA